MHEVEITPKIVESELKIELHQTYIVGLQAKKSSFEYAATEHLRMSAIYWGLTAMDLMSAKNMMACDDIVAWVMQCRHESVMIHMIILHNSCISVIHAC